MLSQAELQVAPAPFLNRFEKYRITHADLLEAYLQSSSVVEGLPLLRSLLESTGEANVYAHVQRFVQLVGTQSFYGFAERQTVESAFLAVMSNWESPSDVVSSIQKLLNETVMGEEIALFRSTIEMELEGNANALQCFNEMLSGNLDVGTVIQTPLSEPQTTLGTALLAQCMLQEIIDRLLNVAVPEQLFKDPTCLPRRLLQSYTRRAGHFSLRGLFAELKDRRERKSIVYTRTSTSVFALQTADVAAERKLEELLGPTDSCSLVAFSHLVREQQLLHRLTSFVGSTNLQTTLLIVIDALRTPVEQINFVRHKLDELMVDASRDKHAMLLLHSPIADFHVRSCYDTTFCRDWSSQFLDSVDADVSEWLRFASDMLENWTMVPVLEGWVAGSLDSAARSVDLPSSMLVDIDADGLLVARKRALQTLLDATVGQLSVKTYLLQRYADSWSGEDGTYALLREHVQSRLRSLAAGELNLTLKKALTGAVRHMFTKFLMTMICKILEGLGSVALIPDLDRDSTMIVAACIKALSSPPFPELAAPLRSLRVSGPPFSPSGGTTLLPFFAKLSAVLDVAAAQANLLFVEYQEDDVWLKLVGAVEAEVRKAADTGDAMAEVVVSSLLADRMSLPDSGAIWDLYLRNFVSGFFSLECGDRVPLQHRVLVAWLESHDCIKNSTSKIAALHAVASYNKDVLIALVASIEPLATIAPEGVTNALLAIVDANEEQERADELLNNALVNAFYEVMLTTSSLPSWADAFARSKMENITPSVQADCVDFRKLHAMLAVRLLVEYAPPDNTLPVQEAVEHVGAAVTRGEERSERLSLSDVWAALQTDGSTVPPAFASRLVDQWLCFAAKDDATLRFIVNTIMSSCSTEFASLPLATPEQFVPVLESLLFGTSAQQACHMAKINSLDEWSRFPDKTYPGIAVQPAAMLEKQLDTQIRAAGLNDSACAVPYWFNTNKQVLAASFFHLAWKWLIRYHAEASVVKLCALAHKLAPDHRDRSRHQRIGRFADRVCGASPGAAPLFNADEFEVIAAQLDIMRNENGWVSELVHGTSSQTASTLEALAHGQNEIVKWWINAAGEDRPRTAITGEDRPRMAITAKMPSLLGVMQLQVTPASGAYKLVVSRILLRHLWVLPDVVELYQYVTTEVSGNLVSAMEMKSQTMAEVIERSLSAADDPHYLLQLWLRVKVGINLFWKHLGVTKNAISDDVPLFNLLSTEDVRCMFPEDCLYQTITEMARCFREAIPQFDDQNSSSNGRVAGDFDCFREFAGVDAAAIQDGFSDLGNCLQYGLNQTLSDHTHLLTEEIESRCSDLEFSGDVYKRVARSYVSRCDPDDGFDAAVLASEFATWVRLFNRTFKCARQTCRFDKGGSGCQDLQLDQSQFEVTYHSLEHDNLIALIRELRPIHEMMEHGLSHVDKHTTVRTLLEQMYPGAPEKQYFTVAHNGLPGVNQRSVLLSTPASELPALCSFLSQQISSELYLFAAKDLALKQRWPNHIQLELEKIRSTHRDLNVLRGEARALEGLLVQHELKLAQRPEQPLWTTLARSYKSQAHLFKDARLLKQLKAVATACSTSDHVFNFTGAHCVMLRLMLRLWSGSVPAPSASVTSWSWPFVFNHTACGTPAAGVGDALSTRMRPWFLSKPLAMDDQDAVESARMEDKAARIIQRFFIKFHGLTVPSRQPTEESHTSARGRGHSSRGRSGRGGSRSRGRQGKFGPKLGAMIKATAVEKRKKAKDQVASASKLKEILQGSRSDPSLVDRLNDALADAQSAGLTVRDAVCANAKQRLAALKTGRLDATTALKRAGEARPLNLEALQSACQDARDAGVAARDANLATAERLAVRLEEAMAERLRVMQLPFPGLNELKIVIDTLNTARSLSSTGVEARLREIQAEHTGFVTQLSDIMSNWIEPQQNGHGIATRAADSQQGRAKPGRVNGLDALSTDLLAQQAAREALSLLSRADNSHSDLKVAVRELDKPVLGKWTHRHAYLALAFSANTELKDDVEDACEDYLGALFESGDEPEVVPAFLLALSRCYGPCHPKGSALFMMSCLRRCNLPQIRPMMTDAERTAVAVPFGTEGNTAPSHTPKAAGDHSSPEERWKELKAQPRMMPSESLDRLMALTGLKSVKQNALEAYVMVANESALEPDRRVDQTHNFALLGNPGTGKTTVARLIAGMLKELGLRNDTYSETTGEELSRIGADGVSKLLEKAMGGTLFIDEAYALYPSRNADAAAVAMQMLLYADEMRSKLTIIIAGYKDDIEKELFAFNSGFASRFSYQFVFEDYTEAELAIIFHDMCVEKGWPPENQGVVDVAARRLSRGRGRKNFGNARAARDLFEAAYRRVVVRDTTAKALTTIDIVGPPPDRANVPELGVAMDELEAMIGLDSVKQTIRQMVELVQTNYARELDGKYPYPISLNRAFLGNPGTGKTTVARLYGKILKAAGLLTDGTSELKQPSDLTGSAVGETAQKTADLVKNCKGKVLIIDEAYALNTSTYGHEAIDALVGLVHGAPGEDVAVVMIGYEKQMKRMFREVNPGLSRRFNLTNAIRFEDFDDNALEKVIMQEVNKSALRLHRTFRAKVVKHLAVERSRPNFGNAGAAVQLVAGARERMVSRDRDAQKLELADFGLNVDAGNGQSALAGLVNIVHVETEIKRLRALVMQCERDDKDPCDLLESYVFVGSPGTGKTTVAKVMADALHDIGMLACNTVKVYSGLDLQASFVGQTKDKVNDAIADAQGGVLFIDEAYTLANGLYSQEAVDQLVHRMAEPEHLNKTVVILAGYREEMDRMLASANTGLKSRFKRRIDFPDWAASDCVQHIVSVAAKDGYQLQDGVDALLLQLLESLKLRPGWANARDSITIYKSLYEARAVRLTHSAEPGQPSFVEQDVQEAMGHLMKQRPEGMAPVAQLGVMFQQAAAPPSHNPVETQGESQTENIVQETAHDGGPGDDDAVFAALLEACKQAGFDSTHDKRQELVEILRGVEQGADFPPNIVDPIVEKTKQPKSKALEMLRPQVHRVMAGMLNAIRAEEERLAELKRLEGEKKLEEKAKLEAFREKLRQVGPCPAGYSWHREGSGWRCAGGSHVVSDGTLPYM